ncbi:MAG: hypothetical protein EBZ59_03245 [Planctomycetia bacterium]|nr:hypothetical protein [Planctomycetia bacterium]
MGSNPTPSALRFLQGPALLCNVVFVMTAEREATMPPSSPRSFLRRACEAATVRLALLADAVRRRRRLRRYRRIYDRFHDYTMISAGQYVTNLELAASVDKVPGCVVECGVWRGGMAAGLAEVLGPQREYVLSDSFEGLPPAKEIDGANALEWQKNTTAPGYHDNCSADESYARAAMSKSGASKVALVKGWFQDTVPHFSLPAPFALLRLDGDWYESTSIFLESLFRHVTPGGLIVIDDYYFWEGCTRATHDFLSRHARCERIASHQGVCYIRKLAEQALGDGANRS